MRLYEKFRPPDLEQVIGHEAAKKQIECTLRSGWGGKAFWISGRPEQERRRWRGSLRRTGRARCSSKSTARPRLISLMSWARTRWVHNMMVNEGLLKKDSPRGVWEIGGKGKAYLHQND